MAQIYRFFQSGTAIFIFILVLVKANIETNIISAKTVPSPISDDKVQTTGSLLQPLMRAKSAKLNMEKLGNNSEGNF